MTRSALRMAIQQAGSRACAASSMNKVLNLRPVNILLAELTSVQAITRASPNNASLMRISSSVARSFSEFIFCRIFSRSAPCANVRRARVLLFGYSIIADNRDGFQNGVHR